METVSNTSVVALLWEEHERISGEIAEAERLHAEAMKAARFRLLEVRGKIGMCISMAQTRIAQEGV